MRMHDDWIDELKFKIWLKWSYIRYKWPFSQISNFFYWLRCHTVDQYHIVDCRNKEYSWGFQNTSDMMQYACWILFCDFVEKEIGYPQPFVDGHDWGYEEYGKYGYYDSSGNEDEDEENVRNLAWIKELYELYEYWNWGRAVESENTFGTNWFGTEFPLGQDRELSDEGSKRIQEYERHSDEMFDRLMKIRPYLST